MTDRSDFPGRASQIRELIAANDWPNALKGLLDVASQFAEREHRDEATVCSMKSRQIDTAQRRRELDFDKACERRTSLAFDVLGLLHSMEEYLCMELT